MCENSKKKLIKTLQDGLTRTSTLTKQIIFHNQDLLKYFQYTVTPK